MRAMVVRAPVGRLRLVRPASDASAELNPGLRLPRMGLRVSTSERRLAGGQHALRNCACRTGEVGRRHDTLEKLAKALSRGFVVHVRAVE